MLTFSEQSCEKGTHLMLRKADSNSSSLIPKLTPIKTMGPTHHLRKTQFEFWGIPVHISKLTKLSTWGIYLFGSLCPPPIFSRVSLPISLFSIYKLGTIRKKHYQYKLFSDFIFLIRSMKNILNATRHNRIVFLPVLKKMDIHKYF